MALSLRLQAVLDYARGCKILADIGTDHAYLPIEAVATGACQRAIACDLNKGPLEIAATNIKEAGFCDQIETRLGNGLTPLWENEADCISISGMGSTTMWNILLAEPNKAQSANSLILQPQHDYLDIFRKNLHGVGYKIESEKLVLEDSRFYVILLATYVGVGEVAPWSAKEYFFGKYLNESPHFEEYLEYHRNKIARYIDAVSDSQTRELAATRLEWVEEEHTLISKY